MEKVKFIQSTLADLLQYEGRHGFIFKGATASSEKSIENLCRVLIGKEIAVEMPEIVAFTGDNTFAAIYGEGVRFESAAFYQATRNNPFGIWGVDILSAALNNFKNGVDIGQLLPYSDPNDSIRENIQ